MENQENVAMVEEIKQEGMNEMENQENIEVAQETVEVEMKFGLLITGTMDEFQWTSDFDVSEYENVSNYVLTLNFEDIGHTDIVRCGLYRDTNDAMCVLLQCTAEELNRQHINHMIPMLITALRDDTALGEDIESFEEIYDLIDAIGKLHSIANIINK